MEYAGYLDAYMAAMSAEATVSRFCIISHASILALTERFFDELGVGLGLNQEGVLLGTTHCCCVGFDGGRGDLRIALVLYVYAYLRSRSLGSI